METRPPAQVFLQALLNKRDLVIRPELLESIKKVIARCLRDHLFSEWKVQHDNPLRLPALPFIDDGTADHVIYEIRKDLLVGQHRREAWLKAIDEMVEVACRS